MTHYVTVTVQLDDTELARLEALRVQPDGSVWSKSRVIRAALDRDYAHREATPSRQPSPDPSSPRLGNAAHDLVTQGGWAVPVDSPADPAKPRVSPRPGAGPEGRHFSRGYRR